MKQQNNEASIIYFRVLALQQSRDQTNQSEYISQTQSRMQEPSHTQTPTTHHPQPKQPFAHQPHSQIVQGINNVAQTSSFNCEWIDDQESPQKIQHQRFPSDIQIGLDGINVGSAHHISMNHVQFNFQGEQSINDGEHWGKHRSGNQIGDDSILSSNSLNHNAGQNNRGNMLGNQLEMLNNSKQQEVECNLIERQQRNDNDDSNFFDQENNLISHIQPPEMPNHDQFSQQTQHNQNSIEQNHQLPSHQSNQSAQLTKNTQDNHINEVYQSDLGQKTEIHTVQQSKQNLSGDFSNKEESISKSSIQKQVTVTINEHSFVSKIYDDLSSIQQSRLLKSMTNYLQSNQENYNPFYSLLQAIFTNSRIKSQKSMENFKMYADFFKEKSKQFEKCLKQMQSQKTQRIFQNLKKKQINNFVYVDSKVVLRDIHERNIKKVKLYRLFYKQILEVSNQLKKIIGEIDQKRGQSQKSISALLSIIKSLQSELQKLIEHRMSYQRRKTDPTFNISTKELFKVDNPHIYKDHYLQIKFIIEKQTTYIKKLKQLRTEVIKYITMIFLTDQIMLSAKIKQNLINYTEMLIEVEKMQRKRGKSEQEESLKEERLQSDLETLQGKKDTLSQKKIHEQLKIQLSKRLYECIPQMLKSQLGIKEIDSKMTSQELLQLLNSHFQNEVFFPSIQLEDEFIFYKTQGGWLSRDEYRALQAAKTVAQIQSNNQLKFILTVNKYLHMEQQQKIATIKLNEIKISKKGKFIIISDRGKGIVGFLVNNGNELGRIQLKSQQQADKFASKVKQLVQER